MRKWILFIGGVAIALMLLMAAYPFLIYQIYGNNLPEGWSANLAEMSLGEIQNRLGPPQEEASAKDFQNWIIRHWWGSQVLKVITRHCCTPEEKPVAIIYMVYVLGRYEPVQRSVLKNK